MNSVWLFDPVLHASLTLYLGTSLCLLALMLTRQAYKLSAGFRVRLGKTGFHETAIDAPPAERAAVMLSVFREAWPATVSEMLEDTEAAHGMVFRSLMVAGCLVCLQSDFAALHPAATSELGANCLGVVHLLRRLILALAVGFCFAPATGRDHSVATLRKETSRAVGGADERERSARLRRVPWLKDANVKALPAAKRAELARTTLVGTVHSLLAAGMLSLLPMLELVALGWDAWRAAPLHVRAAAGLDAGSLAWCALAALRLLHVVAINVCMSVFVFHFMTGFFSPAKHHAFKGFWAEYAACRLFAQLMQLAALQAWFAAPARFAALPLPLRAAALGAAALHGGASLAFCARNALLCLRNVTYSEAELAAIFTVWRKQEAAVPPHRQATLVAAPWPGPAAPSGRGPWLRAAPLSREERPRRAAAIRTPPSRRPRATLAEAPRGWPCRRRRLTPALTLAVQVQTLLDAQLAFVERVQAQLRLRDPDAPQGAAEGAADAEGRPPPHSRWLLLRQLYLLARVQAATTDGLPVPASPRLKPKAA